MKLTILDTALALPDQDLIERLPILAAHERSATAELVAHVAALRLRPSLYAAQGYGSLFAYCRHALRLSEDAASNRIHAAKACLRFPVILDRLASGELSLSAVRMLRPHLTTENHEGVLARARNARRADIERLVAELAPRPDVPASIRRLAVPGLPPAGLPPAQSVALALPLATDPAAVMCGTVHAPLECPDGASLAGAASAATDVAPVGLSAGAQAVAQTGPRPVVQPLSPGRYRVQFTVGQDAHDILRRLQTLLRREIPDGDTGAIVERALRVLYREVESAKFGRRPRATATAPKRQTRLPAAAPAYENRIRPGADPRAVAGGGGGSRYIPKTVRRAVWYRDRGQCGFVSRSGRRCVEREYLELHHIQPYALNGRADTANIALRCRLHNVYEAERDFGSDAVRPRPRDPGL